MDSAMPSRQASAVPSRQASAALWNWGDGDKHESPNNSDFEKRFPRNKFGQEASEKGRVWKVYKESMKKEDDKSFKMWKDTLDVLLVFAGLFSTVLTSFIIEANKLLQPDWQEINARANYGMWATAHNATPLTELPKNPDDFSPDARALWSNWLWFISLMLVMTVALIAILAKQWISQYRVRVRTRVASDRAWAWRHRAFHKGLDDYNFTEIISILPLLIHLSLFTFFTGLSIYLLPLNRPLALAIGISIAIAFLGYLVLCFIVPIVRGDCPMSTPVIDKFRHLGYRIVRWLGHLRRWVVRKMVSLVSTSNLEMPNLSKPRDLETYLEDRLFGRSHGPKLSADTLSWMLQHVRNYNDKSVAFEAIGALNVYQHRDTFSDDNLELVRKMILKQDRVLASRRTEKVSKVERAYLLRAALFTKIAGRKEGDATTSQLKVIDSSTSDTKHATPLIRAALIGTPETLRGSLLSCTTRPDGMGTLISMDKPGLAMWSARTTECLLPESEIASASGTELMLDHLAILLWATIQASLPDENGHHLGTVESTTLATLARADEVSYDVALVRRITTRAAHLVSYENKAELFRDKEVNSWVVETLFVWLNAGEQMKDAGVRQLLYDSILAKLASLDDPFRDTPQRYLAPAVSYFATPHFAAGEWSYDALVGALNLFSHQYREFSSQKSGWSSWHRMSGPICLVLARIDALRRDLHREASRDLMTCIAEVISILGNRRSGREDSVAQAEEKASVITGRISLLHRSATVTDAPVGPSMLSTSMSSSPPTSPTSPPSPPSPPPSIWSSACALLSVDYDRLLAQVATRITTDLLSDDLFSDRGEASSLLHELLSSDRMMRLMLNPDGQFIATNAVKISPSEWRLAAGKLRAMDQLDQQAVADLATAVDTARTPTPWSALALRLTRPKRSSSVAPHESNV